MEQWNNPSAFRTSHFVLSKTTFSTCAASERSLTGTRPCAAVVSVVATTVALHRILPSMFTLCFLKLTIFCVPINTQHSLMCCCNCQLLFCQFVVSFYIAFLTCRRNARSENVVENRRRKFCFFSIYFILSFNIFIYWQFYYYIICSEIIRS